MATHCKGQGGQVVLQTMCRALTLGWKFASSLQKKDAPSMFLIEILIKLMKSLLFW